VSILRQDGRRGYETRQPLCTGFETYSEDAGLDQQCGGEKQCCDSRSNHKAFFVWFRVEVLHTVFDLAGDPIVLQIYDLTRKLDRE